MRLLIAVAAAAAANEKSDTNTICVGASSKLKIVEMNTSGEGEKAIRPRTDSEDAGVQTLPDFPLSPPKHVGNKGSTPRRDGRGRFKKLQSTMSTPGNGYANSDSKISILGLSERFRGSKRTSPLPRISEERVADSDTKSSSSKKLKRISGANLAKFESHQAQREAVEALQVARKSSGSMSRSERAALREQAKLLLAQIGENESPVFGASQQPQDAAKSPKQPSNTENSEFAHIHTLEDKVQEPRSVIRTRCVASKEIVSRERSQPPPAF